MSRNGWIWTAAVESLSSSDSRSLLDKLNFVKVIKISIFEPVSGELMHLLYIVIKELHD